jgi:RNAse (barnase) inhibitor barstar
MVTSVKGETHKLHKTFKIIETYSDIPIHWKALEEHFLMLPLVFRFKHFWEKMNFSKKP